MNASIKEKIEDMIRKHLSCTDRVVTKVNMRTLAFRIVSFEIAEEDEFEAAWNDLREDGFLIQVMRTDTDTGKPMFRATNRL